MSNLHTSREIQATPDKVFAAFSDPQRLARWWGPAGFSNTFSACEFKPGGRWSFVMHGPDGKDYPNESVFADIEPNRKVVIDHVMEPKFKLTVTLAPAAGCTIVSWDQDFENADFVKSLEHILVPSNEQNLDRLAAEVLKG
jgi:uncharacterized protein YndB with AHSA1/START domain